VIQKLEDGKKAAQIFWIRGATIARKSKAQGGNEKYDAKPPPPDPIFETRAV